MNDSVSVQSDDDGRASGWGACHSDHEAESEYTDDYTGRSFGKGSKLDGAWAWIEETVDLFRCGSAAHAIGSFADVLDSLVTEKVEPYLGACTPDRTRRSRGGEGKTTDSETVVTPNDASLNSILGTRPRQRAWSSPPHLYNWAPSRNVYRDLERERRATSFPKFLDEAFYVSDVDTFLSDDFTEMELGYFNGLYDHICSAVKTSKGRPEPFPYVCSSRVSGPKSVVLSFDDTISKLTMEDQRSCSTGTLNTLTLDRRATIAAIVRAQARGGWRAMAQEEAEAKAEELSRFGVEHTITESQLSPPAPDENVIIVRHKLTPDPKPFDEQQFEDIQPNFFSSAFSAKVDAPAEGRESNEDTKANFPKPFKSTKSRFLRPFHRKKKDKSDSKESEGGRRPSFLKALTPPRPRKSKHSQPQPGSPTSTTAPSTAPSTGTASDLGEQIGGVRGAANSALRDGPKGPVVFEEVEVLAKRKEPVYSSYIRTASYKIVEDVEILRKESDLSTLKQRGNNRASYVYRSCLESVGEETLSRDYDPADSSSRRESESGSSFGDFAICAEDEDHYTTTEGSSVDSSLKSMTSRLAKELEETEQLRRILDKKDADFGLLRELLQSNESKAVLQRVNSLPNSETLVQ
jgi:hypothetical protein